MRRLREPRKTHTDLLMEEAARLGVEVVISQGTGFTRVSMRRGDRHDAVEIYGRGRTRSICWKQVFQSLAKLGKGPFK